MIGQTISHYKILEKLGEGGMGVVYRARDTSLDRDVAIKFLPSDLSRDTEAKERFIHEAKAASGLQHPTICTVHEIGETADAQLFMVMDLYAGETLKQKIEKEPLPIDEAAAITRQIAVGLAKAHEAGIVHRDIKPANIMVTTDGHVKILDFGLAKVTGRSLLTKSGTTLGTVAYMSPEQARGDAIDGRTDLWSLGVTLYEMVTGRRPFESEYEQALVYSILNEEPKPMRDLKADEPEGVEKICRRAMAKDPRDRYQSAGELIADLEAYRSGTQLSQKTRRAGSRKRMLAYAAGVVALVILALIFNPFNLRIGLQENVAEPKPSLAVVSFDNIPEPTDSSRTGALLMSYLTTSFFQTRDVDVVSFEELLRIQQEYGGGGGNAISATTAAQIARRAKVSTMLCLKVLQLDPAMTVAYDLIDVGSGRIINSRRVSGFSKISLGIAADTLALLVKGDLHVTPAVEGGSVVDVTTGSQEAYRAYVEGMQQWSRIRRPEAKLAFEKAIELDSNFVMAHYELATGYIAGSADTNRIRMVWNLRSKVTERERLLIEALYESTIGENPGRAAEILEQLIRSYPREQLGYQELQTIYWLRLRDYRRAIETGERGLRNDSLDKILSIQQCYLLAAYDERPAALRAADRYIQLEPAEFNSYDTKGDVYLAFGDRDSAVVWWKKALTYRSAFSARKLAYQSILLRDYPAAMDYFRKAVGSTADEGERALAERDTVLVTVHRGELRRAGRLLSGHLNLHRTRVALRGNIVSGATGAPAGGDLQYLLQLAYEEGDYEMMLRYARMRSEEIKSQGFNHTADITSPVDGRYEVAWALLKCGKTGEFSRLMDELKAIQRPGLPQRQRQFEFFAALFALERGEYDAAVDLFRHSMRTMPPNHQPEFHYAVALLKSGRIPEATIEFQRMPYWASEDLGASSYISPMYNYWPIAAVKAHYWLGVAYEQQGKRNQAIREYETFLDTWKNADFRSPEMENAKVRLAALRVKKP